MSNTVPLVTAVTGALVGISGVAFAWWNAGREREERGKLEGRAHAHQRQLAQDARSFESKGKVYEDMLFTLGLVGVKLEAGVQSIEQLWALDRGSVQVRVVGLDESLPQTPRNEELLRLAARVGAFGSAEVSQLAERFVEFAYDLGQAVDSFTTAAAPDEQDEETRELSHQHADWRRNFVLAADVLEETEKELRRMLPSEEPRVRAWEERHDYALSELHNFTERLRRSDEMLRIDDPNWPRQEFFREELWELEHGSNLFIEAANEAHSIISSQMSHSDVLAWETALFHPERRRARLEAKVTPILSTELASIRLMRDELRWLGRRIQERVQGELRQADVRVRD